MLKKTGFWNNITLNAGDYILFKWRPLSFMPGAFFSPEKRKFETKCIYLASNDSCHIVWCNERTYIPHSWIVNAQVLSRIIENKE